MIFPAGDDDDAAGLTYVRDYVSQKRQDGLSDAQILESFGAPPAAGARDISELILCHVRRLQDERRISRALVGEEQVPGGYARVVYGRGLGKLGVVLF